MATPNEHPIYVTKMHETDCSISGDFALVICQVYVATGTL